MSQIRRESDRVSIELAAEITTSGGSSFTATTKNISVGGCCIASAYPLPEEAVVRCALYLVVDGVEEAGIPALETKSTVQWVADTGDEGTPDTQHVAGLKFSGLSQAQQDWLQATIAKTTSA